MSEPSELPPIQQRLMSFVRRRFGERAAGYSISKIIGDASARQYYRLVRGDGSSFILAAYPEPFEPEDFPYKQIHDVLSGIGLPVPEILEMDGALGIVLQQDLGDTTLQKKLVEASDQERDRLFRQAIDHMVVIQDQGTKALKPEHAAHHLAFDEEKLRWELWFFKRHYVNNYRSLTLRQPESLEKEFDRVARELSRRPRRLCHRDYHVRNLMLHGGRLYLIDFQDARRGPLSYDLASLLKDSVDPAAEEQERWIAHYRERAPFKFDDESFRREFRLMALQRLLKALGTYAYQIFVRENYIYEQYIPGTLRRALESVEALGEFPRTRALLNDEIRPQG